MSETIMIITLVSSIVMPVVTSLVGAGVYALRKIRKSKCMGCFDCESEKETPQTEPLDKHKSNNNLT
jgi:hypothetical protein